MTDWVGICPPPDAGGGCTVCDGDGWNADATGHCPRCGGNGVEPGDPAALRVTFVPAPRPEPVPAIYRGVVGLEADIRDTVLDICDGIDTETLAWLVDDLAGLARDYAREGK